MDKANLAILKTLAENGRAPIKELAKNAFLSSPAASSRLERLEKSGVITGYHADFNLQALGYHILVFINVDVPPDLRISFCSFAASCRNVLECHHVTGNHSMLLKAAFESTSDLEAFVIKVQAYGSTKTQVVFSTPVQSRNILE